eukprot:4544699-Pyramimonas_sp.AAC.1
MWGGGEGGAQGVAELGERERCDNAWLKAAQEEFRAGARTVDSRAFLRGRDASASRSWPNGEVTCGTARCR